MKIMAGTESGNGKGREGKKPGGHRIRIGGRERTLLGGILLGMLSFVLLYGVRILDVTYEDWLLTGGDLSQHYLGWCFFRDSDWAFPVGLMDRIAYPNQVSIIFTDSIPLFAVLFKLFRGWLPETFQYFGIWGLICFGLQGGLGALLLRRFVKSDGYAVVGSLFFVLAPIEIYRMYMHTALGAQWLLLAAFLIGLEGGRLSALRKALLCALLGGLCGSIHLYFIPMCGIILGAFLLQDMIFRRKFRAPFLAGTAYCAAAVAAVIMLGGLSHDHQLDAGGLGQFSFNLNGLFNPQGWSKILPDLPLYGDGAGEGLAYPGTGILAALLISAFLLLFRKESREAVKMRIRGKKWPAFVLIAAASIAVSVSHRLALGDRVIWEIPYPDRLVSLWGMFRSCGRFIWPVVYLLILTALVLLWHALKGCGRYVPAAVLVLLAGVQIADSMPQLKERHDRFSAQAVYVSPLQDEIWEELSEKKHLVFVSDLINNQGLLYGLSEYALEQDMTINSFYFAHSAIQSEIRDSLARSLEEADRDTVYLYKEEEEGLCTDERMEYRKADGLIIGTVKEDAHDAEQTQIFS